MVAKNGTAAHDAANHTDLLQDHHVEDDEVRVTQRGAFLQENAVEYEDAEREEQEDADKREDREDVGAGPGVETKHEDRKAGVHGGNWKRNGETAGGVSFHLEEIKRHKY